MSKQELLSRVCELVRQATQARFEGTQYAKLARVHGYADGYMRALMDAALVEEDELLRLIGEARQDTLVAKDARSAA